MNEYHISRAENGFVLRYEDPKIVDNNRKEGTKYKDPMITRVYETDAALIQDLAAMLPKMHNSMHNSKKNNSDDYKSAFNEAASKD